MSSGSEMVFDADAGKLLREYAKIIASEKEVLNTIKQTARAQAQAMREMGDAIRQLGDETEKQKKRQQEAFGDKTMAALTQMAARWVSVATAISGATQMLREHERVKDEAARRQRESERGLSSLAQISTSKQHMEQLVGQAKGLYAGGGFGSVDEAARTVFSLVSAGMGDKVGYFGQLKSTGLFQDTDILARSIATVQTSFGKQEAGSAEQIISKSLAASAYSPATAEQLLEAMSGAGVSAKQLGLKDEEVLAATALLSTASGSAGEGGTQISSLLTALAEKGQFKGRTLGESLKDIQASGMSERELQTYLGRKEAVRAFGTLTQNPELLAQITGEVQGANVRDLARERMQYASQVPEIHAAQLAQRAKAQRELSEQQYGTQRNLADAIRQQTRAEATQQYGTVGGMLAGTMSYFLPDWMLIEGERKGGTLPVEPPGIQPAAPLGPAAEGVPAARPYVPRPVLKPPVPLDEDPEYVRIQGQLGAVEAQRAQRERELREQFGADGRVTPSEEKKIAKELEKLFATQQKFLEAMLRELEAKRKVHRGAGLAPE